MSAIPIIKPPEKTLSAHADLSGGARIVFGLETIVLSPKDTVDFATALLQAVGVDVKLDGSMFRQ